MKNDLAIIIPAFKERFLEQTLYSIERQTCSNFTVYVGDDCGPPQIERIVANFSKRFDIRYKRFPENIGRHSLVQHWDRCIRLSSQPWIWVFSDDDTMESDCVSALYRVIAQTNCYYDIYRFNSWIIDEHNTIVGMHPPHPVFETWKEYLYCMLMDWRISPLQGLVFSREAYDKIKGFLDLPAGWGCDDVIQIALADKKGIALIDGPRVYFRRSRENISSQTLSRSNLRNRAIAQFLMLKWIVQFMDERRECTVPFGSDVLKRAFKRYFRSMLPDLLRAGNPTLWIKSLRFAKEILRDPYGRIGLTYCSALWDVALREMRSFSHRLF